MNKVITLSDSKYFNFGELFIKTRKFIDADFILYGPDLNKKQISILSSNNITYKKIEQKVFDEKMQYLKFKLLHDEIDNNLENEGITFVDFDTFFVKDWGDVFKLDMDLGVTVRKESIKTKLLRAYANGGVIFCKNSQRGLAVCKYALGVMKNGGDLTLKEYDTIFKTLENGRPAHKTHYRTTLRWWVDQVFLSSLVLRAQSKKIRLKSGTVFKFGKYDIGLFDCKKYNRLDPSIKECRDIIRGKNSYIIHLKKQGREKVKKISKIIQG